ncbi:hypothetical protein FRC07_012247 [Ceratobasidium sp. 392]|nr:hypothetical protein FRC07_012247 [Ceratobasidium sp. 392]
MPEFSPSLSQMRLNPQVENINFEPTNAPSCEETSRPWWVDRPTGGRALGVGLCAMSMENLGSPALSVCTSSGGSSPGPVTPPLTNPEYWSDRMGYGKDGHEGSSWALGKSLEDVGGKTVDTRDIPRTVGRKLKKGLKAIFSASNTSVTV